jgi:GNAT superfamily N-acetyltransferase
MTDVDLSAVAQLPSHLSWQVVACMRELWPTLFTGDLEWISEPAPAGLRPQHFVAHRDGVLVSYASVIRVEVGTLATAGLGNVLTSKPYRGRGFAGRVLREADAWIEREGFDAAGLFCDVSLRDFYARRGWTLCPGGTLVGDRRYPESRMMRFLSDRARARRAALVDEPVIVTHPW